MSETAPPSAGWAVEDTRHKYAIVGDDDVKGLAEKVGYLIARGWICQGGIAVNSRNENSLWFYQAMVKP
jgi:hypothetical protein